MRRADIDITLIVGQIIDPIRNSQSFRVIEKIVGMHFVSFLSPTPTLVVKRTNQLFVFGIYTDDRQASFQKKLFDPTDVTKLAVSVRMVGPGEAFAI